MHGLPSELTVLRSAAFYHQAKIQISDDHLISPNIEASIIPYQINNVIYLKINNIPRKFNWLILTVQSGTSEETIASFKQKRTLDTSLASYTFNTKIPNTKMPKEYKFFLYGHEKSQRYVLGSTSIKTILGLKRQKSEELKFPKIYEAKFETSSRDESTLKLILSPGNAWFPLKNNNLNTPSEDLINSAENGKYILKAHIKCYSSSRGNVLLDEIHLLNYGAGMPHHNNSKLLKNGNLEVSIPISAHSLTNSRISNICEVRLIYYPLACHLSLFNPPIFLKRLNPSSKFEEEIDGYSHFHPSRPHGICVTTKTENKRIE